MADEPELLVEDAEGVRTLTLNRPDRLNALTIPLRLAIQRAVEEFDAVDDLRVLVITGAGRGFCAGSDLTGGQEPAEPERLRDHARLRFGWHLPLDRTDKPTIAAVNGVAAGGGIGLAASCDMIVASSEASFAPAFIKIALTADNGLGQTLVRRVGYSRALKFLLEGKRLSVEDALRIGLVDDVYDAETFREQALGFARELASQPPLTSQLTKRLLKDAPTLPRHVELAYEELMYRFSSVSPEAEAVRAEREARAKD